MPNHRIRYYYPAIANNILISKNNMTTLFFLLYMFFPHQYHLCLFKNRFIAGEIYTESCVRSSFWVIYFIKLWGSEV